MDVTPEFLQAVRKQLDGTESREEVEKLLALAGLPGELIDKVLPQLIRREQPVPPPLTSGTGSTTEIPLGAVSYPRVMVDWGTYPEVGHQARPHFMLLCPEPYSSQPDVRVTIDRELDHDASDDVQVLFEDDRLWGFHVPFRLTTKGQDCRPGQYLIELRVAFPDVTVPNAPRCFRCAIRLKVQAPGAGQTLEIDGDGQSIVNLQGHDLSGFSRVVLKGSEKGIINLHNLAPAPREKSAAPVEAVVHEYTLKRDQQQERLLPKVSLALRREAMDRGMFVFRSGRRVIVIPRRQVNLGRNRDNDIALRFLPRNEQHDGWSRGLSRTHAVLELIESGLRLQDSSSTGVRVAGRPLEGELVLGPERVGRSIPLDLGITADVEQAMELELQLLRFEGRAGPAGPPDELIARTVGEPVPALWRLAKTAGVDAVSVRRRTNLTDEEYLLLFREALVRPSPGAAVVALGGTVVDSAIFRIRYIGRCFWLESLASATTVLVNGESIGPTELVPLVPDTMIIVGEEAIRFDRAEQIGLA